MDFVVDVLKDVWFVLELCVVHVLVHMYCTRGCVWAVVLLKLIGVEVGVSTVMLVVMCVMLPIALLVLEGLTISLGKCAIWLARPTSHQVVVSAFLIKNLSIHRPRPHLLPRLLHPTIQLPSRPNRVP